FQSLYRAWLQRGDVVLDAAVSRVLADAVACTSTRACEDQRAPSDCHSSKSENTRDSTRGLFSTSFDVDRRSRDRRCFNTMTGELPRHAEPAREKECSRMARRKRQYGSGSLFKDGGGWAIRWRELEIAPDGTVKKRKCYQALGNISRSEAAEILRGKVSVGDGHRPARSRVTFATLAGQWAVDVLPTKYKRSTQKN